MTSYLDWNSWFCLGLSRVESKRLWYAKKVVEYRAVAFSSSGSKTIFIRGKAITNFKTTLSASQFDLAQQTLYKEYLHEKEKAITREKVFFGFLEKFKR